MRKAIKGIYAMWYREFAVFRREKSRVVSSIALPLFWYFIFGGGIGSMMKSTPDYQRFIFPGFLAMTVIFSSIFNGAYIVWDKKIDFLKEVLIAPLSRTTMFFGKTVGVMTDALMQAFFLLAIGYFVGMPFSVSGLLLTIAVLVIFTVGLVSLGLIVGSFMESPEGYGLLSSFIIYPLFLLSGALYPLENLPGWMKTLTMLDPATYGVDALRHTMLNAGTFPIATDFAVILGFDGVLLLIGTWAFNRMKL